MSFASLASGSKDVVATSIPGLERGVDHLRDQHERDRHQQDHELEAADADDQRPDQHAGGDHEVDPHVPLGAEHVDDPLEREVEALEDGGAAADVHARSASSRASISVAVVVAEQVQETVDERLAPVLADDLGTDDDVTELARHARRQLLAAVDRKREHVGGLVDPEVLALQRPRLFAVHEREPELAVVDSFLLQHPKRELERPRARSRRPRSGSRPRLRPRGYLRRAVPVSSACDL